MLARITSHKKSQICIHGVHQNFVFVARPICPQCFSLKNIPVLKTTKKFSPVLPTAKIGIPSFYTGRVYFRYRFVYDKTSDPFSRDNSGFYATVTFFFVCPATLISHQVLCKSANFFLYVSLVHAGADF